MNGAISAATEFELLQKVSQGDRGAFRELYDATNNGVFFYLYRFFQDEATAEDVLIDTYTEVWKSAKKFKGESRVKTWIFGIARNRAMKELRKKKFHENIDDYPHLADDGKFDAEEADRKDIIKSGLQKISYKHREVLDLVFFHDLDYQEIAVILDIPVGTVKTRVFYAKEALRNTLAKMGVKKDDL